MVFGVGLINGDIYINPRLTAVANPETGFRDYKFALYFNDNI